MNRRTFNKLASFAALAALTDNAEMSPAQAAAAAGEIVLQDSELMVAFDPVSGALTRMQRKSSQWTIERRPAFGVSFRLHAPTPQQRTNFVLGHNQRAASVEKISANQVRLQWKDMVSEHGGVLPITFTATVTLKDGVLTFDGKLDDQSPLPVETIDYPYFGDLTPPSPDSRMQVEHLWVGALSGEEIYPHKAPPPLAHRVRANGQLLGDRAVALPGRRQQHNRRTHSQHLRRLGTAAPRRQLDTLLGSDRHERHRTAFRHRRTPLYPMRPDHIYGICFRLSTLRIRRNLCPEGSRSGPGSSRFSKIPNKINS
jgi:hypothetical protein